MSAYDGNASADIELDYPPEAEAGLSATWPTAPEYSFSAPKRLVSLDAGGVDSNVTPNFFRSARWASDTTSILTTAEDRTLRVLLTECDAEGSPSFSSPRAFRQPDSVNAAIWYPSASVAAPETFCFVASVKDTPVRLLDASDGRLRASYPIIDHQERFVGPHSLAFNVDGSKLYCGFESAIEVFDVSCPGTGERIKTSHTRREKGGQKGLISALAFSAHSPGSYAAGSFTSSVVLYDEDARGAMGSLEGVQGGGVTQIAYHPLNPNVVFVASRRSEAIQAWDLRDTSQPYVTFGRPAGTNQRIAFDVDPWGRWLASGDEDGRVSVWDITSTYDLVMDEQLAEDAISGVQFHAYKPLLLSLAGSRTMEIDPDSESDSDSDSGSNSDSDSSNLRVRVPPQKVKDARLSLWSMAEPAGAADTDMHNQPSPQ